MQRPPALAQSGQGISHSMLSESGAGLQDAVAAGGQGGIFVQLHFLVIVEGLAGRKEQKPKGISGQRS